MYTIYYHVKEYSFKIGIHFKRFTRYPRCSRFQSTQTRQHTHTKTYRCAMRRAVSRAHNDDDNADDNSAGAHARKRGARDEKKGECAHTRGHKYQKYIADENKTTQNNCIFAPFRVSHADLSVHKFVPKSLVHEHWTACVNSISCVCVCVC